MAFCANCSHFDYEHADIKIGEPCLVSYGIWSDWPMDWDSETCLCTGFQPEAVA